MSSQSLSHHNRLTPGPATYQGRPAFLWRGIAQHCGHGCRRQSIECGSKAGDAIDRRAVAIGRGERNMGGGEDRPNKAFEKDIARPRDLSAHSTRTAMPSSNVTFQEILLYNGYRHLLYRIA